jgi:hypothetical protein
MIIFQNVFLFLNVTNNIFYFLKFIFSITTSKQFKNIKKNLNKKN